MSSAGLLPASGRPWKALELWELPGQVLPPGTGSWEPHDLVGDSQTFGSGDAFLWLLVLGVFFSPLCKCMVNLKVNERELCFSF